MWFVISAAWRLSIGVISLVWLPGFPDKPEALICSSFFPFSKNLLAPIIPSPMLTLSQLTPPLRHRRTTPALIAAAPDVAHRWDLRPEGPHRRGLSILKVTRFSVSLCFIVGSEFTAGTSCSIDFTLVDYYPVLRSHALWFYTLSKKTIGPTTFNNRRRSVTTDPKEYCKNQL